METFKVPKTCCRAEVSVTFAGNKPLKWPRRCLRCSLDLKLVVSDSTYDNADGYPLIWLEPTAPKKKGKK